MDRPTDRQTIEKSYFTDTLKKKRMEMDENQNFIINRSKFYVTIILQLSAIIISLFIFVFFYKHKRELKILHNQTLLLLVIVAFIQLTIDLPMPVYFFYHGRVIPATPGYCTWWTYIEFSLNLISELLMATFSIQRHILIFQSHLFNRRLYRLLFYFIPLTICIVYPLVIYLFLIIIYPCDGTQWPYTMNTCGFATCYVVYSKFLALYDALIHNNLPIYIIILSNIVLIIRVLNEKRRLNRPLTWKQNARMALQLLVVSMVFLISWSPTIVIFVAQQITSSTIFSDSASIFAFDMIYCVPLFLPWVCFALLPECQKWIRKLFRRENISLNSVQPTL